VVIKQRRRSARRTAIDPAASGRREGTSEAMSYGCAPRRGSGGILAKVADRFFGIASRKQRGVAIGPGATA